MSARVPVGQTGTSDLGSTWRVLSQGRLIEKQGGSDKLSLAGIREGI